MNMGWLTDFLGSLIHPAAVPVPATPPPAATVPAQPPGARELSTALVAEFNRRRKQRNLPPISGADIRVIASASDQAGAMSRSKKVEHDLAGPLGSRLSSIYRYYYVEAGECIAMSPAAWGFDASLAADLLTADLAHARVAYAPHAHLGACVVVRDGMAYWCCDFASPLT